MQFHEKTNLTTKEYNKVEVRTASRVVCFDGEKVLMVRIKVDDTYSFPGGGVEIGESLETACIRETLEEAGYRVSVIQYLGLVDEYFDSKFHPHRAFNMKSHYFLCEKVRKEIQELDEYEEDWDFEPVWIKPADALKHSLEKKLSNSFSLKRRRYLDRAIYVLRYLTENKISINLMSDESLVKY